MITEETIKQTKFYHGLDGKNYLRVARLLRSHVMGEREVGSDD